MLERANVGTSIYGARKVWHQLRRKGFGAGRGQVERPDPERTPAGYRIYGEDDVERVTIIKTAQRLGITLDEIREILAFRETGDQPCGYVRDVLSRQVAEIGQRIAELTVLRDELVDLESLAEKLPEATPGVCRLIDHVRQQAAAQQT